MPNHAIIHAAGAVLGMPGGWEIIILFAVVLLIFGPKRLPELSRALGRSFTDFKRGIRDSREGRESEEEQATSEVSADEVAR